MQPLFSPKVVDEALQRLNQEGFPQSEAAEELRSLPVQEPLWAYLMAASGCLQAINSRESAAKAVAEVVDRVCEWVDASLERGPNPIRVACQAGCHFCCSIRVNLLADEALRIAEAIPHERRAQVLQRLADYLSEATKLEPRTRFMKPMLCPLNENGLCTVYDVRPLACRSHHSFSISECRTSFDDWQSNLPVTRHTVRKVCCEAAIEGAIDALAFAGHESRVLELPEALQTALAGGTDFDAAYSAELNALE